MQIGSFETEIKTIIIGNGRIGKTSLMTRFADGSFSDLYRKTIGVDYLEKSVFVSAIHEQVTFYLYDTAGQEEYDSMTRSFYTGAGVCMIAFSTVDYESFRAVPKWIKTVREECGEIPILLVQTKMDLAESAAVTASDAEALAKETGLRLFRVCAKENVNVDQVFEQLCVDYVKRRRRLGGEVTRPIRSLHSLTGEARSEEVNDGKISSEFTSKPRSSSSVFSNCVVS